MSGSSTPTQAAPAGTARATRRSGESALGLPRFHDSLQLLVSQRSLFPGRIIKVRALGREV